MGGIIIILSIMVPVLLFCDLTNIYIQLLILTTIWCGGLGFADDYIKIFKHDKGGVSERTKLVLQIHDELIVDCPKEEAETVSMLMQSCMENVVKLKVKLVADAKIGNSWFARFRRK